MGVSRTELHCARTARGAGAAAFGFGFDWFPPSAAPAIFAARNNALLLGLGVIVGACRLLGRGRGFTGAAALGVAAPAPLVVPIVLGVVAPLTVPLVLGAAAALAAPFVLRTGAPVGLGAGRRDGRGPVPADALDVVRERGGREGAAADGGREMMGRAEVVPLKDCREEEREGTDCAEGWRTYGPQAELVKRASQRCI